ncbi:MAG: T9SS type A sorting domain-containing protein, partial [Lacibacter sp.]
TKTVRFNLGRDTTNHPTGNVLTTGTDTLVNGGGYVRTDTHAPKGGGGSLGNGILVLVTYHVTVDAATSYNTIITYGSGMIRYRNQIFGGSSTELSQYPNKLSFIIYPNNGMCSNATGVNYVAAGNGNFGSGTTQNGPNPGLAVPGYSFINISTSNPGDGSYSVVKNLSPSENTNATIARPQSPSTDRVFGVWDIIGDHTSAVDPIAGNAPVANGANGGYMLAVNSALQLSVANNQTITSLCEDTYYEFSAWFRNVCKRCGSDSLGRGASQLSVPVGYIPTGIGDSSGVKPNLTFQIDGVDYYLSGNLDYTGTWGEWVKKGFVFKTGIGQTSLTISIKNNAPGGGGNDWVMDDISFASCLPGLNMRPGPAPSYCINGQVRLSAIVTTYYNNYQYYQWERSTDGGANWTAAPELPGIQTFSYAYDGLNYTDSVAIPSFLANTSYNGYLYRIKVATSTANLATNSCSIYQGNTIAITVNSSCIVLDVNLLQFQGQVSNKKSVLTWQAKADQNPHNFEIERSDDGIQFTKIGAVTGSQNGLTNQYNFTDPEVLSGKKFYRLKIVIQGGANSKFSEIISLAEGSAGKLVLKSLVNPFNSLLQFQIESPEADKIRVDLFDTYGKLVFSVPTAIRKGNNPVSIETLGFLSKGTYILRIKSSKEVINRTIQSL